MRNYNTVSVSILGMAWNEDGSYYFGYLNAQELHLANVYKDPDFIADIELLMPAHRHFIYQLRSARLANNAASENFLLNKLNKLDQELVKKITDKYVITHADILFFLKDRLGWAFVERGEKPFEVIDVDDKGNYTVRLQSDIKEKDILQLWRMVAEHKAKRRSGKATRNRANVYDELVYAIFKAKMKDKKLTYLQIFWQYQEDKLEGYELEKGKDNKIFKNYETFKQNYIRHRPKPKNDT